MYRLGKLIVKEEKKFDFASSKNGVKCKRLKE
jgi:hypothetical protein